MGEESKKPTAPTQQQPKPAKSVNPLQSVQTAKPETQNRNFELNTAKKPSDKNDN